MPDCNWKDDLINAQYTFTIFFLFIIMLLTIMGPLYSLINHGTECQQARDKESAKTEFIVNGSFCLFIGVVGFILVGLYNDRMFSSCITTNAAGQGFFAFLSVLFILFLVIMLIIGSVNVSRGVEKCN